ncbi:hypothetical protein VBG69_08620 [Carnobacterium maltaromaticum]|uniref:hypothetical protein n=1 Tax=Carnobacterium maltaromaticum TaxID=2751 RepID=UPI00378C46BF
MPDFNFKPAVMGTRFYRGQRGLPGDENITKIILEDEHDVFELGFELTLGGLNYLKYPDDYLQFIDDKDIVNEGFQPFYLNFIFYYQRGMRDSILINHYSIYIDTEMLKEESIKTMYTITKFRNDIDLLPEDSNSPDFISGIYHLNVSMSESEVVLNDESDFGYLVFNNYNTLFHTKIPYVKEVRGENDA